MAQRASFQRKDLLKQSLFGSQINAAHRTSYTEKYPQKSRHNFLQLEMTSDARRHVGIATTAKATQRAVEGCI